MVLGKACEKILRDTEGKIQIHIFPENQLGDDADMLSQLRSGALLKLLAQPGVLMGTLSPVAAINGVGFAYPTYTKVRESLDGAPGKYVRCALDKAGIYCLEKSWNHGFRQVTTSTKPILTPDDFKGFKIRVPDAKQNAVQAYVDKTVTLGIRPEHLMERSRAAGDAGVDSFIQATVDVVELLGNEVFVYLTTQGTTITARMDPDINLRSGQQIEVTSAPDKLHFFDIATEKSIR